MSDQQNAVSGGFIKAFIPGLIVGFIVGAAVGVIVASTGGNVSRLTESNEPVSRAPTHDRDGNPIERAEEAIDDAANEAGEAIEGAADQVEEAVDEAVEEGKEAVDELKDQVPPQSRGDE